MANEGVNTLIEDENENTETNLELDDNNEPDTEDDAQSEGEGESQIDDDNIDYDATLAQLDDDRALEFLTSGKLPDGVKYILKKSGSKDEDNADTEPDTDVSGNNQVSISGKSPNDVSTTKQSKGTTQSSDATTAKFDTLGRGKSSEKSGQTAGNNAHSSIHKHQTTNQDKADKPSTQVDYKAVYEAIFRPFKANGREVTPSSPQDVISLMQKGIDYTKKVQGIAQQRKTYESISRANISMDELNTLIDIHNGNKDAIKKILGKHKIDPHELDMETNEYAPGNNILSDDAVELYETLDEVGDNLPKIDEIMNRVWDKKSKYLMLNRPELILKLNEEIEHGRFDIIQAKLEQQKTFGRYDKSKCDIERYVDLVTAYSAEEQAKAQSTATRKPSNTPKTLVPDKKGAAPNKASKAATQNQSYTLKDIASMSDEQLMKLDVSSIS